MTDSDEWFWEQKCWHYFVTKVYNSTYKLKVNYILLHWVKSEMNESKLQ